MLRDDIVELNRLLEGGKVVANTVDGETNLMIQCPLARWTHKNGRDRHPSFSIKVNKHGPSIFYCFGCQTKGRSIRHLLDRLKYFKFSNTLVENFILEKELDMDTDPVLDDATEASENIKSVHTMFGSPSDVFKVEEIRVLPERELDRFSKIIPSYILSRGISVDTGKLFELRLDTKKSDPRVVFPVRSHKGELVGIVGRTLMPDHEQKYKNYMGFKKTEYLYGEYQAGKFPKRQIIVCEGMVDTLALWDAGFLGLGFFGSKISDVQVSKLEQISSGRLVTVMFDGDIAGNMALKALVEKCKDRVLLEVMVLPSGSDPASLHCAHELKELISEQNGKFVV